MPSQHSILGPSGASRWMNCTASAAASIPYEHLNESSSFADEGTAAHELSEWALRSDRDCDAFIGRKTENGHEVTVDMARDAQVYVSAVRDYAKGHTLLIEQRVSIEHITTEPEAMGTSDAVIINQAERELQVHDLKFGRGVRVDAWEWGWENGEGSVRVEKPNPQMAMYALGVYDALKEFADIDQVLLVIHQPRLGHLSEFRMPLADLLAFGDTAHEQAKVAWGAYQSVKVNGINNTALTFNPSPKACLWCKAKASCPALRKKALNSILDDFEDIEDVTTVKLVTTIKNVDTTPDEALDKLYPLLGMIEDWGRSVLAQIDKRLHQGASFTNCKLVMGKKGNRRWDDEETVEQEMKRMRLKEDEMYDFKLISVPTAEKRMAKEHPKRWEKLSKMITQSDGRPSVAPIDDKREAIVVQSVKDDFNDDASDLVA